MRPSKPLIYVLNIHIILKKKKERRKNMGDESIHSFIHGLVWFGFNQKDDEVVAAFISFRVLASQSRPSYRPSPLRAHVPCICHFLFFSSYIPSPSHTSIAVIAPFCTQPQSTSIQFIYKNGMFYHPSLIGIIKFSKSITLTINKDAFICYGDFNGIRYWSLTLPNQSSV